MMRDLDQIRERDDRGENSKLLLIAVGGLAAACVLFAMGVMIGKDHDAGRAGRHDDPLARLDALANQMAASAPPALTYPTRLGAVTEARPTPAAALDGTAAAGPAERTDALGAGSRRAAPSLVQSTSTGTQPIADVHLAGTLEPVERGRAQGIAPAALPVAAANRARLSLTTPGAAAAPASAGGDGAFTLQVSSFRTVGAAQSLSQRLRERGHRAFVANAPQVGGVTWHRVRIGPFANLHEAQRYRTEFESRERLPTFVVRRDEGAGHAD
ncbi:MAG: SPOR domain-containing protein [Deltaproteobacteria bacterium]